MKWRKLSLILIFSFILGQVCISAQNQHPSFEPVFDPLEVFKPASIGPAVLSADQIFELALRYSECEPGSGRWAACIKRFEDIKKEVTSAKYKAMDAETRGRAVLKFLYRDYLKTYSFNQTRIDIALETGMYNCVSSGLLYMVAAKAAGLTVCGQRTTEHAFCSVYVPNKIDVETTNPYGFNPGSKEAIENEDKIERYYVVPKKYYSNRQEVTDVVFAGLIASNVCALYIDKEDYMNAVPLGAARYEAIRLENNKTKAITDARRDLDILATNYLNTMPEVAEEFAGMVDWYISYIDRWGMTDYCQRNLDNACYNLLVLCFNEMNYELALESYEKAKTYISQKQISKLTDILTDILVSSNIEGLSAEEQIQTIEILLADQDLESAQEKRVLVYLENAWLTILNECMLERSYGTGYQKSCEALERLPQSTKIKKMQKSFYDNCIAIIHNNFAEQANAKRFDQARQVLEAGMQVFPNDKTLNADMATLNKMQKN